MPREQDKLFLTRTSTRILYCVDYCLPVYLFQRVTEAFSRVPSLGYRAALN